MERMRGKARLFWVLVDEMGSSDFGGCVGVRFPCRVFMSSPTVDVSIPLVVLS